MNDDFIYKALPKVNQDFAESLYARISISRQSSSQQRINFLKRFPRRLQVALIVLGVLILVAWSQMRLWIRYVPIGDLWLVEFSVPEPGNEVQTVQPISSPGHAYSSGYENVAPGWIPDGFSPTQIPVSEYSYGESIGMWSNDKQETIRLFVVPKIGGARPYAPSGMYEEIQINGWSAILVFGRLAPNSAENPQAPRQWDETLGLQLSWSIRKIEDSIYTLETLGPYVSEDDLIRMAESVKKVSPVQETMTP